IYQKEFGYYVLDKWIGQGYLKPRSEAADYGAYLREVFGFDEPVIHTVAGVGDCFAEFYPMFEEKILEDRGAHELVQDRAGRHVLYFKGRRDGFMPQYVNHPVKDMASWERDIKWRLDPGSPERDVMIAPSLEAAKAGQEKGHAVSQLVSGGYMYLRSLIGGEALLYKFYDEPELIHDCMQTWLAFTDARIAHHQKTVTFDEVVFDEDICYNHGSLISPDMIREFLFPYYGQLFENMKHRNGGRKLHIMLATDGKCEPVLDLYKTVGVDYISPCEVASGCDVVHIGREHPDLLIAGGIDKRLIAEGGDAIKRHLEYIMPAMRRRGGYIPTCDHGVPEEVTFENYMRYRELMKTYCE
ncbi:MAG: hypothetical protein IJD13_05930, partial [Oscillospiraceae bacterium]|nr:hypothetical protein [Oscillospiraceae bacterium]